MAERRQLTKEEKEFTQKNLDVLEKDLAYAFAMLRQNKLTIDIAPIVFEKQLSDLHTKSRELEQKIEELEFAVKVTKDQLKNGVVKKDVQPKESK